MPRAATRVLGVLFALVALPSEAQPELLLCAPFDGTARPGFARGRTAPGTAGATDVLLHLHGAQYEPGKVGQAVSLRQGGLYFAAPGNFREQAGTLSLWVRPNWSGTDLDKYATFFGLRGWGLFYKYTDQAYLTFATTKADGFYDYGCTARIETWQPGEWHHLAITWDQEAKRRRVFIDGEPAAEGEIPSHHPGSGALALGVTPGGANPADALVDEVYIFGEPLAPEEIKAGYARAAAGEQSWPVPPQPEPPPPGPPTPTPEAVDWSLDDAPRVKTATREKISLNGLWRFQPVEALDEAPPRSGWGYLRVPSSWPLDYFAVYDGQLQPVGPRWRDAPLREYMAAWYEREFAAPAEWRERSPRPRIALTLESVRALGTVYLNGQKIGEAIEYEPFRAEVGERLRFGEPNVLSVGVSVLNPEAVGRGLDGDAYLEIGPALGRPRLEAAHVQPQVRARKLEVAAEVEGEGSGLLQVEVRPRGEEQVALSFASGEGGRGQDEGLVVASAEWRDARTWSPEDPFLYELRASLRSAEGRLLDELYPIAFGFRDFEIRGGDFYLNGKKTHLKGQSSPPLHNYNFNASEPHIRAWFEQLRAVGVYVVREYARWNSGVACHNRDKTYPIADEMGMLIMPQAPGVQTLYRSWDEPGVQEGLARRMRAFVRRYGNHACAIMWMQNFNLAAYVGDICPDWLDGSKVAQTEELALRRRVALEGEALLQAADRTRRPIFHHACGDLGQVYSCMAYLDFGMPLQEREEWPARWQRRKHKPLMIVETGFPCILSWYRERVGSLHDVYTSECLATEYAAAYLGDRAYENLALGEAEVLATDRYSERIETLRHGCANYQELKELWGEDCLRSWRGYDMSGYCLHVEVRECFNYDRRPAPYPQYNPKDFGLQHSPEKWPGDVEAIAEITPLGRAMQRANMPVLVYIAGPPGDFAAKDHAFFSGEEIVKQACAINDTQRRLEIEGAWQVLDRLKRSVADGRVKLTVEPGGIGRQKIAFRAPEAATKTKHTLVLALASREDNWEDRFEFEVFPKAERPKLGELRVGLLDREGGTGKMLKDAGVRAARVGPETDLSAISLLVVGRESLDAEARALLAHLDINKAIHNGLDVVCFEQTGEQLAGMRLDYSRDRRCFVRAAGDPAMADLSDEDLRNWRGRSDLSPRHPHYPVPEPLGWPEEFYPWSNTGIVCSYAIEKPQAGRFEILADCGYDLLYTPLMRFYVGEGSITFCQLDVTARYRKDPAATLIVNRLLTPTAGRAPGMAAYVGGPEGKALLDELGLVCEVGGGDSWHEADRLIVGEDAPLTATELAAWLGEKQEREMLILERPGDGPPDWLPVKASLRTEPVVRSLTAEAGPLGSLCPADLFWRAPRRVPVIAEFEGESQMLEPGTIATTTWGPMKALITWCTVLPGDFGDSRAYTKTCRVLSQLLSDMTDNVRAPDLTASEVRVGGEGSVYVREALDFNPHKFRRW